MLPDETGNVARKQQNVAWTQHPLRNSAQNADGGSTWFVFRFAMGEL